MKRFHVHKLFPLISLLGRLWYQVMTTMFWLLHVNVDLEFVFFFHQEKSEKVVLDVVDQVFPTVLEKVLHTTPQSEKVLHSSTSVRKTAGCLKFSS